MALQPVAFYYHQSSDLSFRWERGASEMQVLRGNEIAKTGRPMVHTIPVSTVGWQDSSEVRRKAQAWLSSRHSTS